MRGDEKGAGRKKTAIKTGKLALTPLLRPIGVLYVLMGLAWTGSFAYETMLPKRSLNYER